jgi:hypothetical protein
MVLNTTHSNRFLRARKFDVALTKKMLLDAEQWRKDFGVDDLVKCAGSSSPDGITAQDAILETLISKKEMRWPSTMVNFIIKLIKCSVDLSY